MEIRRKTYTYSSQSRLITIIFALVATICVVVELILLVNYFKSGSMKNKRYSTYLLEYEKVEFEQEEIDDLNRQYETLSDEVEELEKQVAEISSNS